METPPRKRGRPPKHPKVANNANPSSLPLSKSRASPVAVNPDVNLGNIKAGANDGGDVDMLDRPVQPARTGQRGRKKSVIVKKGGSGTTKGSGCSSSDREKSEPEDDDLPVEKPSTRRAKKASQVQPETVPSLSLSFLPLSHTLKE